MTKKCTICQANVPWAIADPDAVAKRVASELSSFYSGLRPAEFTGTVLSHQIKPVKMSYYCTDHWAERMEVTPEGIEDTGAAPPAQTWPMDEAKKREGISFACTHKMWQTEEHEIAWPKIVATYVHELVHWYSHEQKGLQDFSSIANPSVACDCNWDEAVTDYLAANIFPKLAGAHYCDLTNYNKDMVNLPSAFASAWKTKITGASGYAARRYKTKLEELEDGHQSKLMAGYLDTENHKGVGYLLARWHLGEPSGLEHFLKTFKDELKKALPGTALTKVAGGGNCSHGTA